MSQSISLLDRILDPLAASLTDDAARHILAVQPDPQFQSRIDELAAKANSGTLTQEERSDYEDAIDLLGVFKAKARAALARRSA